ncbi:MAG: hypothetical protein JOY79_11685 [Acidobacteriaceae bacterium]|nr:hypothetical protein [Acidobacteriaceae bacterium]
MRSGNAIGWQARGLDEQVLKALHLSTDQGTIARVTHDAVSIMVPAREFDAGFASAMGIPAEQECLTVPLVVKDRVAALMYADAGNGGTLLNPPALELLVRSTALWLEVLTTRKASAMAASAASSTTATETMSAAEKVVEAVSPTAQPAAPAVSAELRAPTPAPPPAPVEAAPVSVTAPPVAAAQAAPQDQEIQNKARRFAKLLVDEIKLYNQEKVAEGKRNKNLYEALRDDIDKSRATYEKRYSATAAAAGDFFNKELIRSLADNDASLLGSNYPG